MSRKKRGSVVVTENGVPETKAERFARLATRRVGKAMKMISYLVPLANARQYEYTIDQSDKIIDALQERVNRVKRAFEGTEKTEDTFTL